uniref:Uncharacterized protein n=1 Tax=Heterorhabditis bacteriophora TaxID=37862 RepID=A0A1I7XPQ1_HETBA
MTVDVASLPYSTIVLHCLKYPAKGVAGLLLGTKCGEKVKVPFFPVVFLTCVRIFLQVINLLKTIIMTNVKQLLSVLFHFIFKFSINPFIGRLAERVASSCGSVALLVQVINWQLSADCSSNCLSAHIRDGDSWKETKLETPNSSLSSLSMAIQTKLYRQLIDFENHLDKPECDFYNTHLSTKLNQLMD